MRLHFELGPHDRMEVNWPGRATDSLTDIPADQIVIIQEGGK